MYVLAATQLQLTVCVLPLGPYTHTLHGRNWGGALSHKKGGGHWPPTGFCELEVGGAVLWWPGSLYGVSNSYRQRDALA